MDVWSTDNITKRSKKRRKKRDAGLEQLQADISQILQMTPQKNKDEDLAEATAIQRARAAALKHDHASPDHSAGAARSRELTTNPANH